MVWRRTSFVGFKRDDLCVLPSDMTVRSLWETTEQPAKPSVNMSGCARCRPLGGLQNSLHSPRSTCQGVPGVDLWEDYRTACKALGQHVRVCQVSTSGRTTEQPAQPSVNMSGCARCRPSEVSGKPWCRLWLYQRRVAIFVGNVNGTTCVIWGN